VSAASASGTGPAGVVATRYVAPLREGGSLPGLVEADDDGLYVVKFRGAGQGPKALVAEVIAGEIGRRLGLCVPVLVEVDLDAALGRPEPDPEIRDLIEASAGLNLGVDFLPGALPFDPAAGPPPDPEEAAAVVWLDALTTNIDRTPRNPNLLVWHGRLWLIDHGAALYLQHGPGPLADRADRPFPAIAEHILLPYAGSILDADARLAPLLAGGALREVVRLVPDQWLADGGAAPDGRREDYVAYLGRRMDRRAFAREAEDARRGA
jgi:hypothetical protein